VELKLSLGSGHETNAGANLAEANDQFDRSPTERVDAI
jgi:hypothetical protein